MWALRGTRAPVCDLYSVPGAGGGTEAGGTGVIVLVSGATAVVREHPHVGILVVPSAGNKPAIVDGRIWAMDNEAFTGFDAPKFLRMLRRFTGKSGCRFVTAPDMVAQAAETMDLFRDWEPAIHAWGWPVAFVGQDGLDLADVPWQSCEAVFLGGSTDWKLGRTARDLAAYGRARGKWVHMGRVNSQARLRYAIRIGCDSVDGSSFSRWSKAYIPGIADTVRRFEGGPLLEVA